ncbi:transcriptional regulator [Propionicimonas sp.]|uniref:transcriptional regulator n=1 Tax=Propionicimonas sp. TaxID=1955623 RepID=UPI0039E26D15
MTSDQPAARFDELIHFPTRLRIMASLAAATEVEFGAIEEALGISTSLLSKQLTVLAEAGYLQREARRQPIGRPRTWLRLTGSGRRAYLGHVEALRELTAGVVTSDDPDRFSR